MKEEKIKTRMKTLLFVGVFFFSILPFFANKPQEIKGEELIFKNAFANGEEKTFQSKNNPFGWDKISAYTTYFNQNEGGRCENIAIAASLIDGIIIQPYGEFSFNQTVGKRTEEAGFHQAKIIVNGEYVNGVGGGVCQVSTTLYNAALKAGLTVTEFHPHSLRVGYVAPSRDAMVSTYSDLRFFNPHPFSVCLSAQVLQGSVKITFYGKNQGLRYELCSEILEEIQPPPAIVKEGDEEGVLRAPMSGLRSEMYVECYRGERLMYRKRLRRDEYRPIQGIIVKKIVNVTNKMLSNDCVFSKKML